jgi:hypothetical protein
VSLKYFTEQEINAVSFGVDNGFIYMNPYFLIMCDMLRKSLGEPLKPTCMYRSVEWDLSKGRSGKSDHCKGRGADFAIKDLAHGLLIMSHAVKIGFNAFGISLNGSFIHVGYREELPSGKIVTWKY